MSSDITCTELDRARMIVALYMSQVVYHPLGNLGSKLMVEFKLDENEMARACDWYTYYGLIQAYKFREIDLWAFIHSLWPSTNGNALAHSDPDGCSRIFRRISILTTSDRLTPQIRVASLFITYLWYVGMYKN